ncbi:chromosome loss-related protein [Diatrype stigma]|uniref:Chromosome loss-related protein n=1 Tax=Diatrype stigma TaxID=117547 RepID=A0AAN9UUZ6_9PEZI
MARLSLPSSARLPSSIRVDPSNSAVTKALNRLSRASLLSLVLDWLDEKNLPLCPPLLRRSARRRRGEDGDDDQQEDDDDDDDEYEGDFYPPARSLDELRELYASMQAATAEKKGASGGGGGSKREVIDRIVEGDWRHGLSLYQLAMADLQHLYEHPSSQKWTAFRVQRLQNPSSPSSVAVAGGDDESEDRGGKRRKHNHHLHDKKSLAVPRFHPSTFLQNLQAEVPPDVKAHYNFDRPRDLPLLLLRVFILDSPYSTSLAVANRNRSDRDRDRTSQGARVSVTSFDTARTIYIAFPDASPHVYVSAAASQSTTSTTTGASGKNSNNNSSAAPGAGGVESRSLRALVVDAIPKALSRPRERYTLVPSGLSTRNLAALLHTKGAGRTNAAGGGWGVYATLAPTDPRAAGVAESPLNAAAPLPTPPLSDDAAGRGGSGSGNAVAVDVAVRSRKRKLGEEGDGKGGSLEENPVEAQHRRAVEQARAAAQARFGNSAARVDDGKGIERLDVLIEDAFPEGISSSLSSSDDDVEEGEGRRSNNHNAAAAAAAELRFARHDRALDTTAAATDDVSDDGKWRPRVRLAFHGAHVFAGIRQLLEAGVVDGARMPGWMTGEEGVSIGSVWQGRIRGHRGAGL